MSDSVGKISLDLEVKSDLGKQISSISGLIAKNLKTSLNAGAKSMFDGMKKNANSSVKSLDSNIKSMINRMRSNLKDTLKSVFESVKNVKLPQVKFPRANVEKPKISNMPKTNTLRGPPVKSIDKEVLATQIDGTARDLDITNAKIEQQREKLSKLKESFKDTFNQNTKSKINEQILKTEGTISSLINKSDKLGFKLADLDAQFAKSSNGSSNSSNNYNKVKNSLNQVDNSTKKANNSMRAHRSNISIIARSMFTWGIMFPMILSGLKSMGTGLLNNLKTNEQFSNSLAQIKSNLMIAFTPIYQAILPAINALMSALSIVTQYIASFISAIFGKTFNQSKQATQGLIDAKVAMGAYGDSAKEAGKAAKDALGLASFDEINALNSQNDSGDSSGGGGASKVPQLVAPALDTSKVDSSMKLLVDRIKDYFKTFNFQPLIESFNKVKVAATPIVNNLGKILKWFFVEILDPLAHWTISDLLPAFFNLLAGALDFLNPILEVFMSLGKWLWDSFLQPIASWTGGMIVSILNGLGDSLSNIGKWISEHKPLVEDLVLVLGSFAAAWGLVTGAMNLWNMAVGIWNSVGVIATTVTTGFGLAMKAVNWPIVIAVAAIGAIIAIGVLLYKHWDVVKAKAIEVWDFIKNKFTQFSSWMDSIFLTDWSKQFGFLGDIMNGLLQPVRSVWESVKQIFRGVVDFIEGAFSNDWSRAFKGLVNIFGGIMSGMTGVMKLPLNAVIGLINGAINGLNKISVNIPSWIPGIGGKSFGVNIPNIPYLAKGGIIDSPTLAMVGEAGKEAVVPLENNTQGLDLLASKLIERLGGTNISSGEKDRAIQIILKLGDIEFARVLIDSINKLTEMNNGECLINL
ncbi:hypothetical protein JCM1393_25490 [Clostridium carnis]